MPPLAPMQVRLGGAPSHTIPYLGYSCQCSGAALKNQAMHLQCRAGSGAALQHYSAVWCRARQFNLTFCLEDSLHQFIRTLRAVLQSEVSLSSEDTCEDEDRHKERHPGTHLGHSRHNVPFWRWPWNIWWVYCGYLLRADPTKDFSFSPGQHSNYNYYKTYQHKAKLNHADTRDKFPITLWVLTKIKWCAWSVTSSRLSTRNLLSQYCICWHGFATFYFSFMPIWEFKLIRSPGNNIIHW